MKKHLLLLFFLISGFYFLFSGNCYAQRQLEDYSYQYEKYRVVRDQYVQARNSYQKYKTLTSQTELIKSGKDFLASRNLVLKTYFLAISFLLKQTPNIIPENKNTLILSLDRENTWFADYGESVDELTTPNFDDLLEISQRFEQREYDFKKLAYQTLANIIIAKLRNLQAESGAINFLLEDKIRENASQLNQTTLNQWMESVRNMNYSSQQNIRNAEDYLLKLNSQDGKNSNDIYQKIQEELEKARLELLETIKYQKEILREVSDE